MRRALMLAVAALALPQNAQAARLQTWETPSRQVAGALRTNVLLPDGYNGRKRFPVLYLLHGHGGGYADWSNPARGDVARVADGLGAVIVMPEGGSGGWYVNWWNGGRRGAPAWERYHLDELIPLVERRLKIRAGRRYHAIAGASMGGLGAAFYASQRPGYFGSLALFSAALSIQRPYFAPGIDTQGERHQDVYGDPVAQEFYWRGHNPLALVESLRDTRVYLAVGDGTPLEPTKSFSALTEVDVRQQAEEFVAAARGAGVRVTYVPRAGIHDWPYWRSYLANAIAWNLFASVPENPAAWTYETVAQSGRAWPLDFQLQAPPETMITFSRAGTVLRGGGSGRVALTTGEGCRIEASLPFERTLPDTAWVRAAQLRVSVAPTSVPVGRQVRLRFRVTTTRCHRREPVGGATVALAGRRTRTDRRGRASMRIRPRRRARLGARASKYGFRSGLALVRVR